MKRWDFVTVAMQVNFGKPRPVQIFQFDRFDEYANVTILPVTSILVDAPLFGSILTLAKRNVAHDPQMSPPATGSFVAVDAVVGFSCLLS
jgi:mRNA interferase MazF